MNQLCGRKGLWMWQMMLPQNKLRICYQKERNTHYYQFSSVQLLSRVRLFATPWIAARQAFLSIINSRSLLNLMSIELVMLSNHLILCWMALFILKTLISSSVNYQYLTFINLSSVFLLFLFSCMRTFHIIETSLICQIITDCHLSFFLCIIKFINFFFVFTWVLTFMPSVAKSF